MKEVTRSICMVMVMVMFFVAPVLAAGDNEGGYSPEMKAKIKEMKKELKKFTDDKKTVDTNLKTFDELDFVVFSNQEWTRLHESHSKDVKVNWPDGHYTTGIERHIEDLKALFVYAPDTNIKVHPVKFGSGESAGALEGWRHGRRMAVPGQCNVHEADRAGPMRLANAKSDYWRMR